jgi:hypothetical protein
MCPCAKKQSPPKEGDYEKIFRNHRVYLNVAFPGNGHATSKMKLALQIRLKAGRLNLNPALEAGARG